MKRLLPIALLAVLVAFPARADFEFLGYGLSLELSPLLGPANAAQALPHHDKTYLNDRLIWLNQKDPIGVVLDAQFFGLSQAIFGVSCAVEGNPCPGAEQSFTGGGYRRVLSLDLALTLDYDNVHPGVGFTSDLISVPTAAGTPEDVVGLGGDFIFGISMLGPVYLQAGAGAQPAFRTADFNLVGIHAGGEITAILAIPWVAIYGTAGYRALVPTDAGFELNHGPYVQAGVMLSIDTIFGALGMGWGAAKGIGKGVGGVIGGGEKKKK